MSTSRHASWIAALAVLTLSAARAQSGATAQPAAPARPPAKEVAGIPVNYDEDKVGSYQLPDPLVLSNGKPVRDAKTWFEKRRPEIVKLFEESEYGTSPGRPADMSSTFSTKTRRPSMARRCGGW
jgi:hypothetical protein